VIVPLEELEDDPLYILTAPPVSPVPADPDERVSEPPAPELPWPTEIEIEPLFPDTEFPDAILTAPPIPVAVVPELRLIAPDTPLVPALLVRMKIDPLVEPYPELKYKSPPVDDPLCPPKSWTIPP